jgi:tol-pal system protein YbgF
MGFAGIVACSSWGCASTMSSDPGTLHTSMDATGDDDAGRIGELETRIQELERDLRRVTPQATASVRLTPDGAETDDALVSGSSYPGAESADAASEPSTGPRTVLRLHETRPTATDFPIPVVSERLPVADMPPAPLANPPPGSGARPQPVAPPAVPPVAFAPQPVAMASATGLDPVPLPLPVPVAALASHSRPTPSEDLREYRLGLGHLTARRYEAAVASLSAFLRDHPGSAQADDALYWRGTSHYALRRYREALVDYERVVRLSPQGERAADSLYHAGLCHRRLGDESRAQRAFARLQSDYPNSVAARLALREDTT